MILQNYKLDILREGFNRQLSTGGGLSNRKKIDFVASVGILIVQTLLLNLTKFDIQIHIIEGLRSSIDVLITLKKYFCWTNKRRTAPVYTACMAKKIHKRELLMFEKVCITGKK